MPWNIHFGGKKLMAVDDAEFEELRDQIITAAANGAAAHIELRTETRAIDAIWTSGAPIYFERLKDDSTHG